MRSNRISPLWTIHYAIRLCRLRLIDPEAVALEMREIHERGIATIEQDYKLSMFTDAIQQRLGELTSGQSLAISINNTVSATIIKYPVLLNLRTMARVPKKGTTSKGQSLTEHDNLVEYVHI